MLTFVVVLLALFNFSSAMDKKEAMAACFQQYAIGEDVVNHYMQNGEVPDESNKNQKCFFHCMMNKFGVVDDAGNMDMPKIRDMMVKKYDKMSPDSVIALIDKCSARSETDPCDKVYQFHKCHMKPYLEVLKG